MPVAICSVGHLEGGKKLVLAQPPFGDVFLISRGTADRDLASEGEPEKAILPGENDVEVDGMVGFKHFNRCVFSPGREAVLSLPYIALESAQSW